jgi:hypothetical protein
MLVALIALFVALDGPAAAKRLISGSDIRSSSITGRQIKNHSLGAQELTRPAVRQLETPRKGAVGSSALASGAVTASKLALGSVGGGAIADGSLTARDLGDFAGMVEIDFKPFAPSSCQVAKDIAPRATVGGTNITIADDAIAVAPVAGWPDPIVVVANPGAGNTLRIIACRIGDDPANPGVPIDPRPTVFRYVAFDLP